MFGLFPGIGQEVARRVGCTPAFVSRCFKDCDGNLDRAWNAMRAVLAEVDAELAAKNGGAV
jgi:hypothetical protein